MLISNVLYYYCFIKLTIFCYLIFFYYCLLFFYSCASFYGSNRKGSMLVCDPEFSNLLLSFWVRAWSWVVFQLKVPSGNSELPSTHGTHHQFSKLLSLIQLPVCCGQWSHRLKHFLSNYVFDLLDLWVRCQSWEWRHTQVDRVPVEKSEKIYNGVHSC